MKTYEVGDIVVIIKNLTEGFVYDGVNVSARMVHLRGNTMEIQSVRPKAEGTTTYALKGSPYIWTSAMFEHVDPTMSEEDRTLALLIRKRISKAEYGRRIKKLKESHDV